jgi:hypothetical protein
MRISIVITNVFRLHRHQSHPLLTPMYWSVACTRQRVILTRQRVKAMILLLASAVGSLRLLAAFTTREKSSSSGAWSTRTGIGDSQPQSRRLHANTVKLFSYFCIFGRFVFCISSVFPVIVTQLVLGSSGLHIHL